MGYGTLADFGREVERRRKLIRPKLSANEAGRRGGITGQWWRQIERGRGTPRENVVRMAMIVGWDPDEALRHAGYDEPATADERRPSPEDPLRLIQENWDKLTDRQRAVAADVVLSFAEPHAPLDRPDSQEEEPAVRARELEGGAVAFEAVPESERPRSC